MEKSESRVTFGRRQAALNVPIEMVGTIATLDVAGNEELYLAEPGGWYLLTDGDCQRRTGQNDFVVQEGWSPGFSVPVSGFEAISLFVCLASHTDVHYAMTEQKKLAELLYLG